MGDYAKQAGDAVAAFLQTVYPHKSLEECYALVRLTPMIGVNDVAVETFKVSHRPDSRPDTPRMLVPTSLLPGRVSIELCFDTIHCCICEFCNHSRCCDREVQVEDAGALRQYATEQGLAGLSMWSVNR
jgi:hypothetical protein